MKTVSRLLAGLVLVAAVAFGSAGKAAQAPKNDEDRTLSPYFFVKSDDPNIDALPLKTTSAAVTISGVIADVGVTQVYKNEGKKALEAIYIFPASTRAAVYAMKMTIGDRVIEARIKKRDEARAEYEQARQQGKSASLLEQQRPNVFQMNVAGIMPGDTIKVEMNYTELLVPTDKEYAFVYPTVVGPRYSNQKESTAPASERWVANPYLHQGEAPTSQFDISVQLNAGMPIQQMVSSSHKVNVAYNGQTSATASLDPSEAQGGNRDFILKYGLAGDGVESGLLLFKGERENFFLTMLEPPKRVTPDKIPGREYIFIVDVSGSMHGFPLDVSKKLLGDLIGHLRPTDRFNVLLFSGAQAVLAETSLAATQENVAKAVALIDSQQGGGGTELLPALKAALALPRAKGFSRTAVIVTDGYVTVEEEAFDFIRNNLGRANLFAFGIGSGVNRFIIEGMAHVGQGEPFVVTKPDEAAPKAAAFRQLIESPVLTNIEVKWGGFDAYDVEPKSVPDVLADRPVIVFGKWRGEPKGTIAISGIAGSKAYAKTFDVGASAPSPANKALQYLWARQRIQLLSDYNKLRANDERIQEVTSLGLTYNLLTAYTSFVAVDSQVRNKDGQQTTVSQPLPLPQGVSDYAVGETEEGMMPMAAAPMKFAAPATGALMPRMERGISKDGGGETKAKEPSPPPRVAIVSKVDVGDVTATGGLTADAVKAVVQQHLSDFNSCMAGGTAGKLTVKVTIGADGKVKGVSVSASELKGAGAEKCILQAIKKWTFTASSTGRETNVIVRLVFKL